MNNDKRMCRAVDRDNERFVASKLESVNPGLQAVMMGQNCVFDIAMIRRHDNTVDSIVEVKRRKLTYWGQYDTIHASEVKLSRCISEATTRKCQFWFAVLLPDNSIYAVHLITLDGLKRKTGGRYDRLSEGISTDVEQLVDIPISRFQKITYA